MNVKSSKINHIIYSIVFLIIGLILIIWPNESLNIGAKVIAGIFILGSGIYILRFLTNKEEKFSSDYFFLISSLVLIGISIFVFIDSDWLIKVINIFVGIILIISGISNIGNVVMVRKNDKIWWAFSILPLLILICGIIIIINPTSLTDLITRIEGISLMIEGITTLVVTHRISKYLND